MLNIKKIYLYLVSVIALFILVFGAISLINMGLKTWVFTKADKDFYAYPMCPVETRDTSEAAMVKCDETEQRRQAEENRVAQKQREASNAIAMILIAGPVWFFHWRLARKET